MMEEGGEVWVSLEWMIGRRGRIDRFMMGGEQLWDCRRGLVCLGSMFCVVLCNWKVLKCR